MPRPPKGHRNMFQVSTRKVNYQVEHAVPTYRIFCFFLTRTTAYRSKSLRNERFNIELGQDCANQTIGFFNTLSLTTSGSRSRSQWISLGIYIIHLPRLTIWGSRCTQSLDIGLSYVYYKNSSRGIANSNPTVHNFQLSRESNHRPVANELHCLVSGSGRARKRVLLAGGKKHSPPLGALAFYLWAWLKQQKRFYRGNCNSLGNIRPEWEERKKTGKEKAILEQI